SLGSGWREAGRGISGGKRRTEADVSRFWEKRKNPVKMGKNRMICGLSTVLHKLSTKSVKLWKTLLITCGEADENPKTRNRRRQNPKRQKPFGFGLLAPQNPKTKRRAGLWGLQKWKSGFWAARPTELRRERMRTWIETIGASNISPARTQRLKPMG
ncbi:MAG: hypothetical protein ACLVCR_07130, partial [Lachnospiraceae bacterium]